ncbi:MAG TPA: 30S ribosomal protein S9 [Candidatus Babeliales bacterium]|jgi:small subunit ribosomal protein S9|nr:30S ribosomal protein S9 [Candidatus Babeliales bacterium]
MAKEMTKSANSPVAHGVGRRKTAVARVWLRRGNGQITVNGQNHMNYFDTKIAADVASTPFRVCPIGADFNVDVNVFGGGKVAQANAVKLGIARAFVDFDAEAKPVLKKHGLMTVDARKKERKKYGQKAARRKFQFVKR